MNTRKPNVLRRETTKDSEPNLDARVRNDPTMKVLRSKLEIYDGPSKLLFIGQVFGKKKTPDLMFM
mgnify:CR=1 FL=1